MSDWVDSGWNNTKVKIIKEQFENQPNYRALDGNTDRYCRLAGSLNPKNPDSPGRSELLGVYANGYAGLKDMEAVKKYLTDMYDRAVNPSLDLNKPDAKGGRQDSWNKCFGIDIEPVIVETNSRYDSSRSIGSTFVSYTLPANPGQLPVFAMAEAISVGNPRNIWAPRGTSPWTQNAVPGAMWIWGTPDAYVSTPMNQTFIFYYNFVHSGDNVEGTVVGSIDNTGSITINGNMKDNLGASITPYKVIIKKGVNTIAARGTNLGGPAGFWMAIKAPDGSTLVKTDSEWKCNKYYYPAEVFQLNNYVWGRDEASSVCKLLGATLATRAQLAEAQRAGADWCSTGWVADDSQASYPITTSTGQGCGNGRTGVMTWTPPSTNEGFKAGINCFGLKPAAEVVRNDPFMIKRGSGILNFNGSRYSRYPS
jgi:hypothetical protein